MGSSVRFRRYRSRRLSLHTLTELRAEENYTLWVKFDDGLEVRVYLGELVETTTFGALSNAEIFDRVAIDPVSNEVTWGGGINIDPEVLYRDIVRKAQAALH